MVEGERIGLEGGGLDGGACSVSNVCISKKIEKAKEIVMK